MGIISDMLCNASDVIDSILGDMTFISKDSTVSFISKPFAKNKKSYSAENINNDRNIYKQIEDTLKKTGILTCNIRIKSHIHTETETYCFLRSLCSSYDKIKEKKKLKKTFIETIKINDNDNSFIITENIINMLKMEENIASCSKDINSFYTIIRTNDDNEPKEPLKPYKGEPGMDNDMKEFIQSLDIKTSHNSIKEVYEEDDMIVMELNTDSEIEMNLTPAIQFNHIRLKLLTSGTKNDISLKINEPIRSYEQINRLKTLIDYQINRFSVIDLFIHKDMNELINMTKVNVDSLQVRTNANTYSKNTLINIINCKREEPVVHIDD